MSPRITGMLGLVTLATACFSPSAPRSSEPEPGAGGSGGGGTGGMGGATPTYARVCTSEVDTDCARVEQLWAGGTFSCAGLDDGTLRCFGTNDSGQLGDRDLPFSFFGVGTMASLGGQPTVTLGHTHGCAIDDEGLRCWGRNLVGQLGTGDRDFRYRPTAPQLDGEVSQVATRHSATCARTGGRISCWGHALNGQDWISNDRGDVVELPTAVPVIDDAQAVAVGTLFACALRADGTVWCWGQGEDGQLGRGDDASSPTPGPVTGLPSSVTQLRSGGQCSCVLTGSPADVRCWGRMAGDGLLFPTSMAVDTPEAVLDVQVGDRHACALLQGGRVQCWGDNTYGQLGTVGPSINTPVDVVGLTDATAIAVGLEHTCALRAAGEVVCWGRNAFGQLGFVGGGQSAPTPVPWPN